VTSLRERVAVGSFQRQQHLRLRSVHCPAGDLTDLVLDLAAAACAVAHDAFVHLDQEARRGGGRRQALLLTNVGEVVVVLARPVHVHATGDAVPLGLGRLGSTLWAAHDAMMRNRCSIAIPPRLWEPGPAGSTWEERASRPTLRRPAGASAHAAGARTGSAARSTTG